MLYMIFGGKILSLFLYFLKVDIDKLTPRGVFFIPLFNFYNIFNTRREKNGQKKLDKK